MQMKPRSFPKLYLVIFLMCFTGCASMAERGLLRDVQRRKAPAASLGPEFTAHNKVMLRSDSRFRVIITRDGHGHVFVIDKERAVHHIEIAGNEVLLRETLGSVGIDVRSFSRIDAVEYPKGGLRVVAGDKMFIRSGHGVWTEIKGNRCERLIPVEDDLICTFIAKGEDMGAPKRRDWILGWVILVPVVFWSDVHADKLVIAKESKDGWTILAVFDPEATLSARSDYVLGADRKGLQFLYRSSGGSSAFFLLMGTAPGAAMMGGNDASDQQISYARVDYEILFQRASGSDTVTEDRSDGWLWVAGKPIPAPSFIDGTNCSKLFWRGSIDRRFTVNGASGDIEGLVWVNQFIMHDGLREIDGTGTTDHPWAEVRINGDRWLPPIKIVATNDLPDLGFRWDGDSEAVVRSDAHGNDHVLLVRRKLGFWTDIVENCYFVKTAAGWSAPVVLGTTVLSHSLRDLAIDDKGNAFAVWIDKKDVVKGRWILNQR